MNENIFGIDMESGSTKNDYYSRHLKAMFQLLGEEAIDPSDGELACMEAVVGLMRGGTFGLSELTVRHAEELLESEKKQETEEDAKEFFRVISASVALGELATDRHNIWSFPKAVSQKISETAKQIELAAVDPSTNVAEMEQLAENVAYAAMLAHLLDGDARSWATKDAPKTVVDTLASIQEDEYRMILEDDYGNLEDCANNVELLLEAIYWCQALRTTDFLKPTEGAKHRVDKLVAHLESAIVAQDYKEIVRLEADVDSFTNTVMERRVLSSTSELLEGTDCKLAKRLLDDFDTVIASGTAEDMECLHERIEPLVKSLMLLHTSSKAIESLSHIDEEMVEGFADSQDSLRAAIVKADTSALLEETARLEQLLESLISYEALCTMVETLEHSGDGSSIGTSLNRIRAAIIAGDATSSDVQVKTAFTLMNGTVHLRILEEIMSRQDETGIFGIYKAKLVGPYVNLKVAVNTSDIEKIDKALSAINANVTNGSAISQLMKSAVEEECEETNDTGTDDRSVTAFEAVAEVVGAKLAARRKLEQLEKARAALEASGSEGYKDLRVSLAVAAMCGDDLPDAITEALGLGKISEW